MNGTGELGVLEGVRLEVNARLSVTHRHLCPYRIRLVCGGLEYATIGQGYVSWPKVDVHDRLAIYHSRGEIGSSCD